MRVLDVSQEAGRQIVRLKDVTITKRRGPLDGILQFPNVAWPVIRGQDLHSLLCNLERETGLCACFILQKRSNQQRNVLTSLPQAWQLDGDDVQAVIQILAESSFFDP